MKKKGCTKLSPSLRVALEDVIERLTDQLAQTTRDFVRSQELTLDEFGQTMGKAVELGKLTAIRDHDDILKS